MLHSIPLALPRRLSSDSTSAHLSFNQSRCLLPPLDLGEGDARPISSMGVPIQAGILSVADPMTLPSMSVPTLNLTTDHTKQIFSLACEGQHLKEQIARDFTRLSSEEVLFHTWVQSTGDESLASRYPDCLATHHKILQSNQQSSEAKDKAKEEITNKVNEAWL